MVSKSDGNSYRIQVPSMTLDTLSNAVFTPQIAHLGNRKNVGIDHIPAIFFL
jgi:hypothetical protein